MGFCCRYLADHVDRKVCFAAAHGADTHLAARRHATRPHTSPHTPRPPAWSLQTERAGRRQRRQAGRAGTARGNTGHTLSPVDASVSRVLVRVVDNRELDGLQARCQLLLNLLVHALRAQPAHAASPSQCCRRRHARQRRGARPERVRRRHKGRKAGALRERRRGRER